MTERKALKDIELRLIAELMTNSRRSDRALAKSLGISQPTISRMINRLEKNGVIKEYTIIPDFSMLGFKILAFTLLKLRKNLTQPQMDRARRTAKESLEKGPFEAVLMERGIGADFNGISASYHEDYSSYLEYINWLRSFDFLQWDAITSFLVNLEDKVRYREWTHSTLAKHIARMNKRGTR